MPDNADALNWFALFTVILIVAYYVLHPLVQAKLKTLHNTRLQQALKLTDQLATIIVPEIAVMSNLGKSERKDEAIRFVTSKLNNHGITLSPSVVSAAVENAYQLYKHLVAGDQHLDL
ncbi:phage holin, LLH family [Levilactobacillus mulengensis]|uniref:phage holin, LLH family n=1 Tax=Levilactobacillus mulengensis TaxID=2486025 RepID=UPI0013DE40D8|nr:phage holin, LLH family [Levilactobacillus mulengensis]